MWTTSLKLLLGAALIFVAAQDQPKIIKNCSFAPDLRSNDNVVPIKYDVELILMPKEEVVAGTAYITIDVKQPVKYLYIRTRTIKLYSVCVKMMSPGNNERCNPWNSTNTLLSYTTYCPKYEVIIMIFYSHIPCGQHTLHIEYQSLFKENVNQTSYTYPQTGIKERWIITNLYDSSSIRELLPWIWKDPRVKASFRISIKHETVYTVLSNTRALSQTIVKENNKTNDKQWTNFNETSPISASSLSIAMISEITRNAEENKSYLWYIPNSATKYLYAYGVADNTMSYYSYLFAVNMEFIIEKIDYVILPRSPMKSAGKPGLIIYREEDVTYEIDEDFPGQEIHVAKLITYEIARQLYVGYISSNVTSDWWISEMLASFDSYYSTAQRYDSKIMELFVVQALQTALNNDIFLEQKPIIHKAKDDTGIDGLLYPLLYHKKAFALIRMLVHLLTPTRFHEAIEKYVHLRTKDLWTVLQEEYPRRENDPYTIKEIMDSWLSEARHPEMHFFRNYNGNIVVFNKTSFNSTCKIPLTYATSSSINSYNTTNVVWHEGNNIKYFAGPDSNQFVIINLEQIGYYRVNYDRKNWLLLSAYLRSDDSTRIPALNRAQIVNDAYYFATQNKLEPTVFFYIIQFLKNETDYIVWYPMFNILSYTSTYLKYADAELLKENFLDILDGLLRKVGYEENLQETPMTISLRLLAIKWACELGHAGCRNVIAKKLTAHIYNQKSFNNPWFKDWMYNAGMMTVNMTVWTKVLDVAMRLRNMELLEHLIYSENTKIILHYLSLILNHNLGKKERLNMGKIYRSIVKKHATKDVVRRYVLDNYNKTLDRFPHDFDDVNLLADIIMNVYSAAELQVIQNFITKQFINDGYQPCSKLYTLIQERKKQITRTLQMFKMF